MTFTGGVALLLVLSLLIPVIAYVTTKLCVFGFYSGRLRWRRHRRTLKMKERRNGDCPRP